VPEASLILAGDASSVPAARRFVAQTLESWGQVEASWAAAQIVSELAGNCALHARTEFCVRLVKQDRTVRLEVQDGSAARVQPRHYGRESTTGRGLRLVERLGTDWGVDLHAGGKTVWVALRLSTDDGGRELADGADAVDAESLLAAFDEDAAWERTTASYDVAVFRTAA
jgi:hypothetical protein